MSLLYFLAQGAIISLLREKNNRQYYLPQSAQSQKQADKWLDVEEIEEYTYSHIGVGLREIAATLTIVLREDKVLQGYHICEYEHWYNHNYFKILETETGVKVSITVCLLDKYEEKVRHRMRWILYCLPYLQQSHMDFSVEHPYLPLADGCGCIVY